MFILNSNGQALIVGNPEGFDQGEIFEVDSIPEGSGILRTDGEKVWWEAFSESAPVDPTEALQTENALLKAQMTFEVERRVIIEDLMAALIVLVLEE